MQNICFALSLFHASTCFEHHVLIVRRSKLYYTASGIITPIGDRPVHRLREDWLECMHSNQSSLTNTSQNKVFVLWWIVCCVN